MPWYTAFRNGRSPLSALPEPGAVTAAATIVPKPETPFLKPVESWQREAWEYYDTLGEFNYGVTWLANIMSRVRFRAARLEPGMDEPVITNEGVPAQLVADLAGGVGGQAQLMRGLTVQLSVPGDGYLIGEQTGSAFSWQVRSAEEVRAQNNHFQTVISRTPNIEWADLPDDSLVVRVWRPHARWFHVADSPARSARSIMQELELVNRHIISQYLSRLASAGVFLLPEEVTFPVREEFEDAADPFMAEWIEIAAEAIQTPGTASAVIPIPMRVPAEFLEKIKHVDFTLKLDEKIIEKRDSAITRLASKMDIPTEVLTGMGKVNHWCVDDRTEILTERGWLFQDQLREGDVALTLNHGTGLSEWKPVTYVYRAPVVDEPMVSMERQTHSSLTTPHHRWPVLRTRKRDGREFASREFVHSEDLTRVHRVTTGAASADIPTEAKYTDDLVELVAWLWTEGHVQNGRLTIAQSHTVNPDRVDRIRAALTRLYGPASAHRVGRSAPGWRESVQRNESSHGGPVTIFHLNKPASGVLLEHGGKTVRTSFVRQLTRAQLELFIDVSCQGDGWHYRSGRLDIWQKDRAALEAYELALILSGRPVSFRRSGDGWNCAPSQGRSTVQPMKSAGGQYDRETVSYTGTVWCPVTENQTWFARRNGTVYYTGNTAWQLDEASLKEHVAPLAELICYSLTTGYLQPRMEASQEKDAEQWVVWYDMSELAIRPDKSEKAYEAYDRMELSGEALRRESGFDEDDKPTTEELTEQGLKILLRTVPNAAPAALDKLTGKKILDPVETPGTPGTAPDPGAPDAAPPGPPDTKTAPPPEKPAAVPAEAATARLLQQLAAHHVIRFDAVEAPGGRLLHPPVCNDHAYSCPYTHAAWNAVPAPLSTGSYKVTLDTFGRLQVGAQDHYTDTVSWTATRGFLTSRKGQVNGSVPV